jgi:hypothetical protein
MESVATRLQETGHQIIKQGDAFVVRTRDAGIAFFGETREAGTQLFGAVQLEAKRWRKFATQRTVSFKDLRIGFSVPAVERALLTQVDGTLRALDSRVRSRLAQLDRKGSPAKKSSKKPASKAGTNGKKAKAALPPIAA